MNSEGFPQEEDNRMRLRLEEAAKRVLEEIFESSSSGSQRVKVLLERLGPWLTSGLLDGEGIKQSLQRLEKESDETMFVEKALEYTEPIRNLRLNNPEAFKRLRDQETGITEVNKVFSYGISGDKAHVHLELSGVSAPRLKTYFIDGLKVLAKVLNEREDVVAVTAMSWIIRKNPAIIEAMGFKVEDKEKGYAVISREDFLSRYLK